MSTRTSLRPTPVIVGGDMSGNLTSTSTVLNSLTKVSYSFSWSGSSPVGTVAVQVCNDAVVAPTGSLSGGSWTSLALDSNGDTTLPLSGNTGQGFLDITVTAAAYIRFVYTHVSGTGTLQVTVNGKVS